MGKLNVNFHEYVMADTTDLASLKLKLARIE